MMIIRFIKFSLVGISGAIVGLGALYFFVEFIRLGKHLSWFLATTLAIFNNFTWNNVFTFKDRKIPLKNEWKKRIFLYYLLTFLTTGVNYLCYYSLLTVGIYYLLAAAFGIFIGAGLNFYFSNWIIWRLKNY